MSRPQDPNDETREVDTGAQNADLPLDRPQDANLPIAGPAASASHLDRGLAAGFGSSEPTVFKPRTEPVMEAGLMVDSKYKLIQAIGEGGMGSVWLAEQKEPVKRKVALKLVKAGMDSRSVLARFEAERQALAMMDHPNIAKVLDGGVTEQGRPYFVMELVKGIPLTEYCDQVQFSIRERLELFGQVCSAVQHAHQKGIIHRDLKPSNVLVTEVDGRPVVKVIDFGLAKALLGSQVLTDQSLHTAFGAVLGTPLYMAPEQLGTSALDVDTRADLYSLGVILYELLTGTTPIERQQLKQAAFEEMCRLIREQEPPRPSTRLSSSDALPSLAVRRHAEPAKLTRLVRGELDWIVMKAQEKDRNRRYETADGLAMDVQRYLAGEAVLAAPPSRLYRIQKTWRRHRVAILTASGFVTLLCVGLLGTLYGMGRAWQSARNEQMAKLAAERGQHLAEQSRVQAERERERAEAERQSAEQQRETAETQRARAASREQVAIAAVERFGNLISKNFLLAQTPELRPLRISLLQDQLQFFQTLRIDLQAEVNSSPEGLSQLAEIAYQMGQLNQELGNQQDAARAYLEAVSLTESLRHSDPSNTRHRVLAAHSQSRSGDSWYSVGDYDQAIQRLEAAQSLFAELLAETPDDLKIRNGFAGTWITYGHIRKAEGKIQLAWDAYAAGIKLLEERRGLLPDSIEASYTYLACHTNAGTAASALGNIQSAIDLYEKASLGFENLLAPHAETDGLIGGDVGLIAAYGMTLDNLAGLLARTKQLELAETRYQRGLELLNAAVAHSPGVPSLQAGLANCSMELGSFYRNSGRTEQALPLHLQAEAIGSRLVESDSSALEYRKDLAGYLDALASTHNKLGERDSAIRCLERSRQLLEDIVRDHPSDSLALDNLARIQSNFAALLNNAGDWETAIKLQQTALVSKRQLALDNPNVYNFQLALANGHAEMGPILRRLGRDPEAIDQFQLAQKVYEQILTTLPEDGETLQKVILCLDGLINVYRDQNQPRLAINLVNRQLRYQKLLNSLYPELTADQLQLAEIYHSRGGLISDLGNPDDGLASLQMGVEIMEQLQKLQPDDLKVRQSLNNQRNTLGLHYLETGHEIEAKTVFLQLKESMEQSLIQEPDVVDELRDLGGVLNNLALVAMKQRDYATARDFLYSAIENQRRALQLAPLNWDSRRYLKNHYDNLKAVGTALQDESARTTAERGLAELTATAPAVQ